MAYQDMSEVYKDQTTRERAEMCIREQGMIYTNDLRPEVKALGQAVISGSHMDIDAVFGACVTGPSGSQLGDDGALLAAVQSVWPSVAAARYPGLVGS